MPEPTFDRTVHAIASPFFEIPPQRYGGTETVIANLTRGLARRDVRVVCYCPGDLGLPEAEQYQTADETDWEPDLSVGEMRSRVDRYADSVVSGLAEQYRAGDIVHFHHDVVANVVLKLAEERGVHLDRELCVETCHGPDACLEENVVFPSRALRSSVESDGPVIPHGIDLSRFRPTTETSDNFVLFAGRMVKNKGIDVAVRAAARADTTIHLAGVADPEDAERFERIGHVEFLGEVTDSTLLTQYRNASGLIYLSQYCEPFGLGPVEAMACGTPVITTGRGGTGETVIDGDTGYVCETVEDVAEAIRSLREISADACRARAEEFGVERMVQSYVEFYADLGQ